MSSSSNTTATYNLALPDRTATLLRVGDRSRVPDRSCYVVDLAWPVFAWRALAPRLNAVKADPLQRAILRLARAGVTRTGEVSELLDAEPRLVERLVDMFKLDSLLLDDGQLASNGKELLKRDDAVFFSDSEADLGWIFRDALSGDVVPFFHKGSLWLDNAPDEIVRLPHDQTAKDKPSNLNLLEAMKAHRRFVERRLRGSDGFVTVEDDPEEADHEGEVPTTLADARAVAGVPQYVRLISQNPERIDIPAWFYVNADDPGEWHIASQFPEIDMDFWLEQRFAYTDKSFPAVHDLVSKWIHNAQDAFPSEPTVESEESKLDRELPVLIHKDLEGTRKEMALARRAETLFSVNPEYLDTVLTRYGKAVEAVLGACIAHIDHREQTALHFPSNDRNRFQFLAKSYARQVGQMLSYRFLVPKYADIARALHTGRNWNPRVNALFLLFHAGLHPDGAARSSFDADPKLLDLIDYVTDCRNYSAHHSDKQVTNEVEMVKNVRAAAHRIAEVLGDAFFTADIEKYEQKEQTQ